MRPEVLSVKNLKYPIGNRTRDLTACSSVFDIMAGEFIDGPTAVIFLSS
jgi:hypothetical protein